MKISSIPFLNVDILYNAANKFGDDIEGMTLIESIDFIQKKEGHPYYEDVVNELVTKSLKTLSDLIKEEYNEMV